MAKELGDFAAAEPPEGLSPPLQALWWLKKGGLQPGPDWERAHAIVQTAEGTPAYDRAHALAHLIEGDRANAEYWFRRAGARPAAGDLEAEWALQVAEFDG